MKTNCFLKICPIFFLFFLNFTASAQTITVQPVVSTELNLYTDVSLWVSAPAGQIVNTRFGYFTTEDTTFTSVLSNISLGFSQQFVFENLVLDCDSLWNGFCEVWLSSDESEVTESNNVSWALSCPGEVDLSWSIEEIVDTGVVVTFNYNTGGAQAALYWFISIDELAPDLFSTTLFGEGIHTDTLFLSAGQTYEVCNPELQNGVSSEFLLGCFEGEMDSFVPSAPDVMLSFTATDSLQTELLISNSGNLISDFTVSIEQMLCNGSWGIYEEFELSFGDLILDSLITLPTLTNLPSAPAWRATVNGNNGVFTLVAEVVTVDLAIGIIPMVSLTLTDEGNGFYEAVTTWNDFGAGNALLSYYVDDVLVGTVVPVSNTTIFPIPSQISSYSGAIVEVVLTSNSCIVVETMVAVASCGSTPTHILESADDVTITSANVQISYANFGGCVEEGMVGIILVGVDTVWTPLSVNTEESSNYIIQLVNLTPGQTYVYLGVLYAEGEYFTTNFSLSFTTLSDDPILPSFDDFSVNWDMSMLITLFMYYDLGDSPSVGLRVYHDGPNNPSVEVLDVTVSNEFTSFDYSLSGQYGTHIVWAELYNTQTNVVYETVGPSIHTFQQPVGITEFDQPITRFGLDQPITHFDVVIVYDLSGRVCGEFTNGEMLSPELPNGIYLFVGRQENQTVSSKIYLGQ